MTSYLQRPDHLDRGACPWMLSRGAWSRGCLLGMHNHLLCATHVWLISHQQSWLVSSVHLQTATMHSHPKDQCRRVGRSAPSPAFRDHTRADHPRTADRRRRAEGFAGAAGGSPADRPSTGGCYAAHWASLHECMLIGLCTSMCTPLFDREHLSDPVRESCWAILLACPNGGGTHVASQEG